MSLLELNDELEDVETAIRGYSEELVQHLAVRDELDFEKEVKNSFISVLIDVQNRQKVHREMLRKKRKVKNVSGSERLPSSVSSIMVFFLLRLVKIDPVYFLKARHYRQNYCFFMHWSVLGCLAFHNVFFSVERKLSKYTFKGTFKGCSSPFAEHKIYFERCCSGPH